MSISGISASTSSLWDELINGAQRSKAESAGAFALTAAQGEEGQMAETASASGQSGAFDPLDSNQDGHVSPEELANASQLHSAAQATRIRLAAGQSQDAAPAKQENTLAGRAFAYGGEAGQGGSGNGRALAEGAGLTV